MSILIWKYAQKTLCDQFEVSTLAGFGIDHLPLAKAAAASLIHYAERNAKDCLGAYSVDSTRTKH